MERNQQFKPNIILLMSDQQRWDSLGCNGNSFASTPNLDRMASEGVRFENSFTPWPVCTPARATMWNGVYPHEHRITYNVYGIDNALREFSKQPETVFDLFRKAGYVTAYFGKWHLGEKDPGMFDVWEGFNSLGGHWVDGLQDGKYKPDLQTDHLIDFLKNRRESGEPFLVVNGYYPPHDPYTAPKRFYEPYRSRGIPNAGYYAAVSALDHCSGRIMETLDELHLADNTILIYFSDHGDTFKYRDEGAYKLCCYEEAIKVPLILRFKGKVESGLVLKQMVGLQDLMPTLLEYAGIEIPNCLHGRSLAPLLAGESVPWREAFYIQNITRYKNIEQRCIRTDRWKLILNDWPRIAKGYSSSNFLFDLDVDPEEELNRYYSPCEDRHNRYKHFPSHTDTIKELTELLKRYAEEINDHFGCDLADKTLLEMSKRDDECI